MSIEPLSSWPDLYLTTTELRQAFFSPWLADWCNITCLLYCLVKRLVRSTNGFWPELLCLRLSQRSFLVFLILVSSLAGSQRRLISFIRVIVFRLTFALRVRHFLIERVSLDKRQLLKHSVSLFAPTAFSALSAESAVLRGRWETRRTSSSVSVSCSTLDPAKSAQAVLCASCSRSTALVYLSSHIHSNRKTRSMSSARPVVRDRRETCKCAGLWIRQRLDGVLWLQKIRSMCSLFVSRFDEGSAAVAIVSAPIPQRPTQ